MEYEWVLCCGARWQGGGGGGDEGAVWHKMGHWSTASGLGWEFNLLAPPPCLLRVPPSCTRRTVKTFWALVLTAG